MLVVGSAYFIALAFIRAIHDRRVRQEGAVAPSDSTSAAETH
jgi:hypothetical protein